jgi:TAT-translocated FGD2 family F420-dependent dehydrogenase
MQSSNRTNLADPRLSGRRGFVKSAAALVTASALTGGGRIGVGSQASASSDQRGTTPFNKKMVGFMLPHEQFPAPKLLEFAIAAEAAGFDLLATSDHLQPWQTNEGHSGEAWVTMGAIGQKTQRVWIGTTVTCPTFRYNPAVVAEAFATLDLFYPGRIFLGIGSGEALNEQAATGAWPKWDERSERLVEAAEIIRQLWTGQQLSHSGKYYKLDAKLYDRPSGTIPLLMAGNGPRAMKRCGQYADGLVTDPKTWKQHKSEFEAGAKAAGKDAAQMPVLVEQYAVVGNKQDAEAAARLWNFGPKAFKTYYDIRDPESIQRHAEAEIPLEKVYGDWPVSTDPGPHIKVINDLFASGVSIVNIHTGQPDQKKVIEFYGKEVLPKVNRG